MWKLTKLLDPHCGNNFKCGLKPMAVACYRNPCYWYRSFFSKLQKAHEKSKTGFVLVRWLWGSLDKIPGCRNSGPVVPDLAAKQTSRRFLQKNRLKTIQLLAEGWMLEKKHVHMYIYICIYSIHVLISCCHLNGTSKSALGTAIFSLRKWQSTTPFGQRVARRATKWSQLGIRRVAWVEGRGYGEVSQNDLLVYDNRKLAVGHCVSLEKYDEIWWFIEMGIGMGGRMGMGIWGWGWNILTLQKAAIMITTYNEHTCFGKLTTQPPFFFGGVQLKSFPLPPPGRHFELRGC